MTKFKAFIRPDNYQSATEARICRVLNSIADAILLLLAVALVGFALGAAFMGGFLS